MDIHKRENLEIAFRFMTEVERIPIVNIGKQHVHHCCLNVCACASSFKLFTVCIVYNVSEVSEVSRVVTAVNKCIRIELDCLCAAQHEH